MGGLGMMELALIFLVVLLVFGAKRIPEIARGLGKGIREFKDATSEISKELTQDESSKPKVSAPRQGQPQPRGAQTYANDEPRQEAGRPTSEEAGPAEPVRADNPGAAEPESSRS